MRKLARRWSCWRREDGDVLAQRVPARRADRLQCAPNFGCASSEGDEYGVGAAGRGGGVALTLDVSERIEERLDARVSRELWGLGERAIGCCKWRRLGAGEKSIQFR